MIEYKNHKFKNLSEQSMAITLEVKSIHTVIKSLFGKAVLSVIKDAELNVTVGSGQITFHDGDVMIGQGDLLMNTALAIIKKKIPEVTKKKIIAKINPVIQDVLEYCQMDKDISAKLNKGASYEVSGMGDLADVYTDDTIYDLAKIPQVGVKVHGTTVGSIYYAVAQGKGVQAAVRITDTFTVSIRLVIDEQYVILQDFGLSKAAGYQSTHLACKSKHDVVKLLAAFTTSLAIAKKNCNILSVPVIMDLNEVSV